MTLWSFPLFRRRLTACALGGGVLFAALTGPLPASAQELRVSEALQGNYGTSVMSWRDIPFRTVVRQRYDYSCGSAALATLLHYHYGVSVGEGEIFQSMYAVGDQARIREVGFSMLDMKQYLEGRGFQADGLRINLDRVASIGAPMIALITHDNYRHFVVIKGVRDGRVLVGDPTFGIRSYDRAAFEGMWNGIVLAIRRAPAGTQAAVFNLESEWRPWSRAPMEIARGPVSPADLLRELPSIYQITATGFH